MFYPEIALRSTNNSILTMWTFLISAVLTLTVNSPFVHANEKQSADLTKVYKVVGADGSVSFSDQPNNQSEMLMVAPVPTIPAIPLVNSSNVQQKIKKEKPYIRYQSLAILAPANDSAFYSGSGDVDIILDIQPALLEGDKIQLFLDGQLINENAQIQSRLKTVSRGTHELKINLVSRDGQIHKEAKSVFTVHRPSIQN